MAKAYIIKSDWSRVKRELKRLSGLPDMRAKRKLDAVLERAMLAAQGRTHVLTGSLKASAKKQSKLVMNTYRGHFLFGGSSPGPNNPVDYAIYEMEREGGHDFMLGIEPTFHPQWVAAIKSILRG